MAASVFGVYPSFSLIIFFEPSRIDSTERLKKPVAHIVVGYDLNKTQYIFIGQSHIFKSSNILKAACIRRAGSFDRKIRDAPFPFTKLCLGKVVFYLLSKFLIVSRSTEGRQMACSSVDSPIIGGDDECGNLPFACS